MSTHEYTATLIPGDGIGPEVTDAALEVAAASGVTIRWERVEAGADVFQKYGTPLPDSVLNAVRRTRVGLKGPIGTPIGSGFQSANVLLRQSLDLYACVRPVRTIAGLETPFRDVDLVIVRENAERASLRIARFAFELARREGRQRVTAVHKANIMKLSDGLFLECAHRVAREYPDIELSEIIIDNCAMQLVTRPQQFDVLLLDNLYGDILSDLCAGLVGGLGVVPGSNLGEQCAVFEAVHGSAPDIAGKRLANPCAVVLSLAGLLAHLGEREAAARVEGAVHAALAEPANRTRDLGGPADLDGITRAIIDRLE